MQNYLFERAAHIKPARKKKRKLIILLACIFGVAVFGTAGFLLARMSWPWGAYLPGPGGMPGNDDGDHIPGYMDATGVVRGETVIPRAPVGDGTRLSIVGGKGEELTSSQVYEKVLPSVVSVHTYFQNYYAAGSGVIISEKGYVLTNYHVIEGGEMATVTLLTDGNVFDAKVVGWDEGLDIAVLKIEGKDFPAAEFVDSDTLAVGEQVYGVGNPLGYLFGSISEGVVSGPLRDGAYYGISTDLIQTTAALNKGNSGGALVNSAGQVVGIPVAKPSEEEMQTSIEGITFALPISNIRGPVNSIIANGRVITPRIGITCYEVELDGAHGLLVESATEGETAALAGIQPQDVIIAANGVSFVGVEGMKEIFYDVGVGNEVILTVLRGMEELEIPVLLME